MEISPTPHRPHTVYSNLTRLLGVATWAFCGFLALNLVLTGTAASIWSFLPWLGLSAWAVYVLLWRPRLVVHADGLSVRNLLRDHEIPFSELRALRVVQTVSFDTTAGRLTSWGAPGAGKLGPSRSTGTNGGPTAVSLPATQAVIESAWDAWERSQPESPTPDTGPSTVPQPGHKGSQPGRAGKVETRWNPPTAVVGCLVVLLVAASLLTR